MRREITRVIGAHPVSFVLYKEPFKCNDFSTLEIKKVVPRTRLELVRIIHPRDFKSLVSTIPPPRPSEK